MQKTIWNRTARRRAGVLSLILYCFALTMATALLTVPNSSPSCRKPLVQSLTTALHSLSRSTEQRYSVVLYAKKEEPSESEEDSSNKGSSSVWGWFGNRTSTNSKDQPATKSLPTDANGNTTGFFRSISKRLEDRREAKTARIKAEEEAKLLAALEAERRSFSLPGVFNTSGLSSAIQNVSLGLTQARDELRSVRADPKATQTEGKRLQEVKKKQDAAQRKRLIAQQLSDQRSIERREERKKKIEERELKKSKEKQEKEKEKESRQAKAKQEKEKEKENRRKQKEEARNKQQQEAAAKAKNDNAKERTNPLSVVQKFVASVFEKDEEWIVVAPKTRIMPGEIVPITSAGLDLLLVASIDGSALYCIANSCPHLGTPLEVGMLERRPIEESDTVEPSALSSDGSRPLQENDITQLLTQDGCEDCIVCPLHKTAFALGSGEVRGEWCPYPPVLGKVMGTVKRKEALAIFDVRTRGKNIEVRLNTPINVTNTGDE